jgi:hypothetical protein
MDDSMEIQAWKQEPIRRLRDVLGKVSLKQVEHLLEEARKSANSKRRSGWPNV